MGDAAADEASCSGATATAVAQAAVMCTWHAEITTSDLVAANCACVGDSNWQGGTNANLCNAHDRAEVTATNAVKRSHTVNGNEADCVWTAPTGPSSAANLIAKIALGAAI